MSNPVHVVYPPRFKRADKRANERKFNAAVPMQDNELELDLNIIPILNPEVAMDVFGRIHKLEKSVIFRNIDEMEQPYNDFFFWNEEAEYFFPTVHPKQPNKHALTY